MATQQVADAGGTTVSFSNTPQAKDDAFYFSEDSTGVLILNVLANDLGGAAKLLYSVDNSISASTATKTPAPSDLLIRDTTYSSTNDSAGLAGTTDTSFLGARIWIASDGTIHYNTADINTLLQSLAQGQVLTDKLTYAIQLGNGTLSWATTTIQFTGTNDKPLIAAATLAGAVTEDAHTPTETATGTIAFGDVDLTDVHLVSAVFKSTDYSGQLGSLAAVKTTDTTGTGTGGLITWTFSAADSALDKLAAGQVVHETYTVTLDDQHGGVVTRDVVITITGTNDVPVIGAATLVGAVTEDAHTPTETATGTIAFGDVDLTDVHLVSAVFKSTDYSGQLGSLAAVKTTDTTGTGTGGLITWTFSAADSALDKLAAGQVVHETYTVTLDDQHGGVVTRDVVITITGTNDAPTITAADTTAAGSVVEDAPTTADPSDSLNAAGTIAFHDVDLIDGHTATFVATAGETALGTFSLDPVSEAAGAADGTLQWHYALDNNAAQYLAAGQSVVEHYTVTVDDGHGGTVDQVVAITITGTNDNPTMSATATGSVTEDTPAGATETASGTVSFADVDLTDTHTVSSNFVSSTNAGGVQLGSLVAAKTLDTSGGTGGTGTWNYSVNNAAIQFLAAGQTIQETYQVTVADNHGGSTSQNVVVTITGTNDNPTMSATATGSVTEDTPAGATETASGTVSFADVDLTDTHTVSSSFVSSTNAGGLQLGSLVAAKTLDTSGGTGGTGTWNYSVNNAAIQFLAAGQTIQETYQVTVADNHGGSTSQNVVVTITGTNDNPTMSATATGSVTEDTPAGATETASGTVSFADVDLTDTHTVSSSFVSSTNAGGLQLGSLVAAKTLDTSGGTGGTGTWNYSVNNAAIQFLATGQTIQETYQVTVADNHGGSTSQNVVVTITGTNDAPAIDLDSGTAGTSTSINYTAGSAATAIAPSATVTDVDSADFNGGKLTVAFAANGTSADQLTIQNQGTGAGQIGVSGSSVTYGGTTIGTFTGGTNGSNLVITFNANATQAAAAALADHILYSNATSPNATKTVTYTLVDGDGTANGGTDTGSATATINVTGSDSTPPSVSISHQLSSSQQQSTFTVHATDASGIQGVQLYDSINGAAPVLIYTFTAAELAAGLASGNYVHTFDDGVAPFPVSNSVHQISAVVTDNSAAHNSGTAVDSVTFKTNGGGGSSSKFTAPAGTAGEPINLALTDPSDGQTVTVTVKDLPSGWIIDGATQNADGSWTVQSNAIHELTVTTPADFVGAAVLDVHLTWTNADGTAGSMSIADNVEAYAQGSPIFAWSGDDVLTGSSGHDLFVFSQPIGNDTVHSFDAAADQIDLIGYSGLASFGDLQTHITDDAHGNAVITLGDGQSITLEGVHSSALGAGNFVFDQTPVVNNTGTMTLGDGALLPLSGTVNNSGLISLNSTGDDTLLQVIQHGVTLQGGGQVVLSDNAANFISGTGPDVTLINVDNTISGAGQLGDGMLSLDNKGTIVATGTNALVIDTGGSVVVNSGMLEATGSGGLVVAGGLANSGTLWANGGDIVIDGAVTGVGDATIGNLSKLEFGGASSSDVTFAHDAAGTLELDDSFDYSGHIGGITNDDKLDLNDILFGTGTTVAYQASQDGSGGILSVSDGAHNATLHLLGTYDANGFKLADDGEGHTVVTYNPEFTLTGVAGGTGELV
ncbi:MAG: adhesin [Mesorhizobium sp.]|uniref:beta strand repeat-containing protein n=1 Tax=Mesorhizobium sp. TaxID=1871066 RepID=UPI000FEAA4F1|nr:VCBS domain-containing protein [Mesorhizobium sp.]RWB71506.1 MAG: adhesin [Mesorhizobium sp.]